MQKSSIFSKFTCPDKKAEKISSPNEQAISSHLANTKQYEETKLQLEEALKENAELRQEVLLLNETMTALPLRLEADLGVEDFRVEELKAKNTILAEFLTAQEKKFKNEILQLNSIMESKDNEIIELTKKLDEANSNILFVTDKLKNQEVDFSKTLCSLKEKFKKEKEEARYMQEQQEYLLGQLNTLKEKWHGEARKMLNKTIAHATSSYKEMLAVEELGFLKSMEDLTRFNPSSSAASVCISASSSYEKVNTELLQDLTSRLNIAESINENQETESEYSALST